jgi:hypothetical protein
MALRNKRYVESPGRDAPPVTTMPNETAAQPPPAVDAKPPEQPTVEPSAADQAAQSALKARLQEMEQAERITREAVSHPQLATEPQEPQAPTTEQILAASALPERAKNWLRQRPEYVTDPIKNARLVKMHNVAEYQAGGEFTDSYFDRMEILLGLKQEAQPRQIQERPATQQGNGAQHSSPARQQQRSVPMSAPPTRDVPSMSSGRPQSHRAPLTQAEHDIARSCGISPQEYAEQKEKMERMKAAGALQDGR